MAPLMLEKIQLHTCEIPFQSGKFSGLVTTIISGLQGQLDADHVLHFSTALVLLFMLRGNLCPLTDHPPFCTGSEASVLLRIVSGVELPALESQ